MLRPYSRNSEEQNPSFDSFNFYKKTYFSREKELITSEFDRTNIYEYYAHTPRFYIRYIETFGWNFIRLQLASLRSGDLLFALRDELRRCEAYEKAEKIELRMFIERYHHDTYLTSVLVDFAPFVHLRRLTTFIRENYDMPQFERLCAILIAYVVYGIYEGSPEDYWFEIANIFNNEMPDDYPLEVCDRVLCLANDYLEETNLGRIFPEAPHRFPARPCTKINPDEFIAQFTTYALNSDPGSYNKNGQIHIGQQTFYKPYMQLYPLYDSLCTSLGTDCFDGLKGGMHDEVRKKLDLFRYTYEKNHASEQQRFSDYLSMLDCEFLAAKLLPYVPVSLESVKYFIRWNYKGENEAETLYLALLMTYWLYDKEDLKFATSDFVFYFLFVNLFNSPCAESYDKRSGSSHSMFMDFANDVIEEINYYGRLLNLPLIAKGHTIVGIQETGTLYVPWTYVDFCERFYLINHPNHYRSTKYPPLRVDCHASRRTFNEIKSYFQTCVPPLQVQSVEGVIKRLMNEDAAFDLNDYVQTIYYKSSRPKGRVTIERKTHSATTCTSYTKSEAKRIVETHKSYYLDQLCKMQLPSHRVYHCAELRATETSYAHETAFIFVIKEKKNHVILAFENTLDSRSTLLFTVKKKTMLHAIGTINMFLSSGELNKRQLLQWRSYDFNDESIVDYNRIIHTSTWDWNAAIRRYL